MASLLTGGLKGVIYFFSKDLFGVKKFKIGLVAVLMFVVNLVVTLDVKSRYTMAQR